MKTMKTFLKQQERSPQPPADSLYNPSARHLTILNIRRNWQLYVMLVLPLLSFLIFNYIPMYGAQIAFRKFNSNDGISGSRWMGLYYFEKFFNSFNWKTIVGNTLRISLLGLVLSFPIPIIISLALHACIRPRFKKLVQNAIYIPHFISLVVMCGLITQFLDIRFGAIPHLMEALGMERVDLLASPKYFDDVYVWSGIWQNAGWGTVIYLASLSDIDPTYYEAAELDGASRLHKMIYIDLPMLMPTMVTMLILNCGRILNVGYQKILLLQNDLNLTASEVISTYSYKIGLASSVADFSYSTAIGLMLSVCNLIMIALVNGISRKLTNSSVW